MLDGRISVDAGEWPLIGWRARGARAAERGSGEREADERCERIVAFRGVDSEARAMSATR